MINLEPISQIWNIIVKSNTFNFIIFVLILVWIFKKINVNAIITSLQQKIIKILDEVKKNHEDAKNELLSAEKAVENLGEELKVIVEDATKSAEVISQKILSEAQKQIESIENNATKVIEAEEKLLISKLTESTSLASVETAKKHIKSTLEQTPTLHEKYINESIEELDRLNLNG
ncbi:MAG: ATP synthase F0 subunit B [Candidatus Gastranaerophilales bacterium]|nr:ATP synthase F0 subunit B [Candidatus Gastranaerophilales bacterium]